MAGQTVNYTDHKNFRPCRKKQYEIWVCKPPVGTVVINKLEQSQAVKSLNGKDYFTLDELQRLQSQNQMLYTQIAQAVQNGMAYCVKEGDLVLSGTRGELSVASIQQVQSMYACFHNGAWSKNWQAAVADKLRNGCFDWVKAQSSQAMAGQAMACFVPVSQKGQIQTGRTVSSFNSPGVDHGLGDFIVCNSVGGKPNLSDCRVVNGAVFADTYNNQGWSQCIKPSGLSAEAPTPPKLFSSDTGGISTKILSALKKALQSDYKLTFTATRSSDKNNPSVVSYDLSVTGGKNDNRNSNIHIVFHKEATRGEMQSVHVSVVVAEKEDYLKEICIVSNKSRFEGSINRMARYIGSACGVEGVDALEAVVTAFAKSVNIHAERQTDENTGTYCWKLYNNSSSGGYIIDVIDVLSDKSQCRLRFNNGSTSSVLWTYEYKTPLQEAVNQLKRHLAEAKRMAIENVHKFHKTVEEIIDEAKRRYGVRYKYDERAKAEEGSAVKYKVCSDERSVAFVQRANGDIEMFIDGTTSNIGWPHDRVRFEHDKVYGWDEISHRILMYMVIIKFSAIIPEFAGLMSGYKVEYEYDDGNSFAVVSKDDQQWRITLVKDFQSHLSMRIDTSIPELCSQCDTALSMPVNDCAKVLKEKFEMSDPNSDRAGRPLTDIASDFDTMFRRLIDLEGYKLSRYIGVERHYDKGNQKQAEDKQAGFVPLKYQINGDNDDILVIDVKFERDKSSKNLKVSYRGQSQGVKVNEQEPVSADLAHMTGLEMRDLASKILQTFVVRLNLSPTRRFDKLVEYLSKRKGYTCEKAQTPPFEPCVAYWTLGGVGDYKSVGVYLESQDSVGEAKCYIYFKMSIPFTINLGESILKNAPVLDAKIREGIGKGESGYYSVH